MKAKAILKQMRRVPKMFASNKEAFCATIATALWMEDVENFHSVEFYKRHMGPGNSIAKCNDKFTDKWARAVVDDALTFIKDAP